MGKPENLEGLKLENLRIPTFNCNDPLAKVQIMDHHMDSKGQKATIVKQETERKFEI